MPSRLAAPVLSVSINDIAKVDTTNVDDLFTMWTIFSKCADSLENGRRLENLSWRLWNRETFCVAEESEAATASSSATVPAIEVKPVRRDTTDSFSDMPALSESVDSVSSDCATSNSGSFERPALMRRESSRGREKHMTPVHLAKLVDGMRGDDLLNTKAQSFSPRKAYKVPAAPMQTSAPTSKFTETEVSMATSELSTHSIVRGFSPNNISSSIRTTRPTTPEPVTTSSVESKTKKPMFIIGSTSSDGSYLESYRAQPQRKRTSFKEEVVTRTVYDDEDDYSTEEEIDESAIEEDDEDWEDSFVDESLASSPSNSNMFARVEERPQLPSRRSLLSTLLHEPSRAAQLANQAGPNVRVSRATLQGPSVAPSPSQDCPLTMGGIHIATSRPLMATTSIHPPALSPRTTRRNMFATELTESLRQNLLWERKQKDTTASAVLKRRHTAYDNMNKLTEYPQLSHMSSKETSKNNSWNHFFDGFHEYHVAGW